MPRLDPGKTVTLIQEKFPGELREKIADAIQKAWNGLYKVNIHLFSKKKEKTIANFYVDGVTKGKPPDPGDTPEEDLDTIVQWCYSILFEKSEQIGEDIPVRIRFYSIDSEEKEKKTYSPQFVFKTEWSSRKRKDEENDGENEVYEDVEEEEEFEDEEAEELYEEISKRVDKKAEKNFDKLSKTVLSEHTKMTELILKDVKEYRDASIAFLEKRYTLTDLRETSFINAIVAQNDKLTERLSELSNKLVGTREAQIEITKQSNQALATGVQMMVDNVQYRGEIDRQRAEERVARAEEEAKRQSRNNLLQGIVTALVGAAPQLFMLARSLKDPSAPMPTWTPPTNGVAAPGPSQSQAPNETITVESSAVANAVGSIHVDLAALGRTITPEQHERLKVALGEDYPSLMRVFAATTDLEAIMAILFIYKGDTKEAKTESARKIHEEIFVSILTDEQQGSLAKVLEKINAFVGGNIGMAGFA